MNEKATGNFIAEIRKQKNMTQKDLAEVIGVSDKTISKWETGKSLPDLAYLGDLCKALDITVNEILAGQRISENDYSKKAEETIMSLMKDNEKIKTTTIVSSIIGIILILFSFCLLFFNTQNGFIDLRLYIDLPSLLLIALPSIGIIFLTKKRDYLEILKLLNQILIPIGLIVCFSSFILVLSMLNDLSTIGPNLAVCILSFLYACILKLVVVILIARKE